MLARPAVTPGDFSLVRALFVEYADSLGVDLSFQDFDQELASLEQMYGHPGGRVLIGRTRGEVCGAVAVRKLDTRICEMKRLYVRPAFRGTGAGRVLALCAIRAARAMGYERMRLDTLPTMTEARSLYASLGFHEIPAYRENPIAGTSYMELEVPDDDGWWPMLQQLLETSYVMEEDPRAQSGFTGDEARWEAKRRVVADAIDRDGTFLDVGCANGYLMESVVRWTAARGLKIEPHGLDVSSKLAALARSRLPQWADRIHVGNALTWEPPQRYDVVRTELGYVPQKLAADLLKHLLAHVVGSAGWLLVCFYSDLHADAGVERVRASGLTLERVFHGPDVMEDPSPRTVVARISRT